MIRFAILAFTLLALGHPVMAADNGGFGSGFSQKAPAAFSDPTPEALAKYQDALNPSLIEPAAGEPQDTQTPVKKEEPQQDAPTAPLKNTKE